MSSRIDQVFQNLKKDGRKAFVAYVCGGDPDPRTSLEILRGLARAGADIIEVGVPFSDPMADGIVNQLAAERALKAGMSVTGILDLVRKFREVEDTPIVIFTYLNPIYAFGYERFHHEAAAAGADGILLLDLPPEEAESNAELAHGVGLQHVQLISPTTPATRLEMLAKAASGFVYALSRTGVTGAHGAPAASVGRLVKEIKTHTETPVCVGFGINTADQAREIAAQADGIIVGSAIVKMIAGLGAVPDLGTQIENFVRPLADAAHEAGN